jgi:hypothetical protein
MQDKDEFMTNFKGSPIWEAKVDEVAASSQLVPGANKHILADADTTVAC